MVSTRTLFAVGIAIIAIASLGTVVVVQELASQRQPPIQTRYVTSSVTSAVPTSTAPHVLITYYGWVYTEFGGCSPSSGNVLLIVHILRENHGYDRVPIASTTLGNLYPYYFYVGINGQQFNAHQFNCLLSNETLPMTDVVNGLSVKGFIVYDVPANFGSYSLIYQPPGRNGTANDATT